MIRPYQITDAIISVITIQLIVAETACVYIWIKRKALPKLLWLTLTTSFICLMIIVYGIFVEPLIVITRYDSIDLEDYISEEPAQIILIADLHVGRFLNSEKLDSVVKKINELNEIDNVLILGDVVNGSSEHLTDLDILKNIDKAKKLFFIYGNHDYHTNGEHEGKAVDGLEEKLKEIGITILDNKITRLDNNLVLAGIDDEWTNRESYEMLEQTDPDDTVVLMAHNPDAVIDIDQNSDYKAKVDIIVSGHTHGGEMRLPVIGPLSPLPTKLPDSYDKGFEEYNGIPMYITSGLGNVGVRMRIFNNPEIVVLTIN